MGALPSREANESPNTIYFTNSYNEVTFRLPLTPHYFPSASCLAFQQLLEARAHQSGKYSFDVRDLEGLAAPDDAAAFRDAQREDWGPEARETDPSVYYFDDRVSAVEGGEDSHASPRTHSSTPAPATASASASAEELYKTLVLEPASHGNLVNTNAEMCTLYAQEQKWLAAQKILSEQEKRVLRHGASQRTSCQVSEGDDGRAGRSTAKEAAELEAARRVQPPPVFLTPLPEALVLQMSMQEVREAVMHYRQEHGLRNEKKEETEGDVSARRGSDREPQRFHDDKDEDDTNPYQSPPGAATATTVSNVSPTHSDTGRAPKKKKKVGEDPDALDEEMNDTIDEEKLLSYPCFSSEPLPFECDDQYMDGRVHLVTHEGVNYIFAYNPAYVRAMGKEVKVDASAIRHLLSSEAFRERRPVTPTGDEPPLQSIFQPLHPDDLPPHFCWDDGAESHVPRAHFTTTYEVATRRPHDFDVTRGAHVGASGAAAASGNVHDGLSANETPPSQGRTFGRSIDDGADPNQRRTYELLSETYEKYYIPILPVEIIGMDGMLRTQAADDVDAALAEVRTRRAGHDGNEEEEGAAVNHDRSTAPRKTASAATHVPVMKLCRFISATSGDKVLNRLATLGALVHLERCLLAGLPDALTRPLRACFALSDVPQLQFHREMSLRYTAATLEIGFHMKYIREGLARGESWNDFLRFVNSPMYGFRHAVPPEKIFRHQEILTGGTVVAAMENKMTIVKNIRKRQREGEEEDANSEADDAERYADYCALCDSDEDSDPCGSDGGESLSARSERLYHRDALQCSGFPPHHVGTTPAVYVAKSGKVYSTTRKKSVPRVPSDGSGASSSCRTLSARSDAAKVTTVDHTDTASETALSEPEKSERINEEGPTTSPSDTGSARAAPLQATVSMQAMTPTITEYVDADGHLGKLARYCQHDFLLLREMTMLTRGAHATVRGRRVMCHYTAEACRNISQALSRAAAPIITFPYIGRFPVSPNLVFAGGVPAGSVPIPADARRVHEVAVVLPTRDTAPTHGANAEADNSVTPRAFAVPTMLAAIHPSGGTMSTTDSLTTDSSSAAASSEMPASRHRTLSRPTAEKSTFDAHPNRRYAYACLPPPSPSLKAHVTAQYAKGLIPCFAVTKQQDNFFLNPHQPDTTVGDVLSASAAPIGPITAALTLQMEGAYIWSHLVRVAHLRNEQRKVKAFLKLAKEKLNSVKMAKKATGKLASAAAAAALKRRCHGPRRAFGHESAPDKGGAAVGEGPVDKRGDEERDEDASTVHGLKSGASYEATSPLSLSRATTTLDIDEDDLGGTPAHMPLPSALHEAIPTFDGDVVVLCPHTHRWVPLRTFQQLVRLLLAEKNDMGIDGTDPVWRGVSERTEEAYRAAVAAARDRAARQLEERRSNQAVTAGTGLASTVFPTTFLKKADQQDTSGSGLPAAQETPEMRCREEAKEEPRHTLDPRQASIFDICAGGHCCCVTGTHGRNPMHHRSSGSSSEEITATTTTTTTTEAMLPANDSVRHEALMKKSSSHDTRDGAMPDAQQILDINYNTLFDPAFIASIYKRVKHRLLQERPRYGQDPSQLARLESPIRFYGLYEILFTWNNAVLHEERFENKEDPGWLREYGAMQDALQEERPPILQHDGFCMWSYRLTDGLSQGPGALVNAKAGPSSSIGSRAEPATTREVATEAREPVHEEDDKNAAPWNSLSLPPFLRLFTNDANEKLRFFLGTKPAFQRRHAMRQRVNKRRKKRANAEAVAATPPTKEPSPHGAQPPVPVETAVPDTFSKNESIHRSDEGVAAPVASVSQPRSGVDASLPSMFFPPGMSTDTMRYLHRHDPYRLQLQPQTHGTARASAVAVPLPSTSGVRGPRDSTIVRVNVNSAGATATAMAPTTATATTTRDAWNPFRKGNATAEEQHLPKAYRGSKWNQIPFPPPPPPSLPPSS